jgi:hypothetical protein
LEISARTSLLRALLTLVIGLTCAGAAGSKDSANLAIREFRKIKISDRATDPAEAAVKLEVRCLTERGARNQQLFVKDRYGARVDKVTVRVNGKKIHADFVSAVYPKRQDVFFSDTRLWAITIPRSVTTGDVVTVEYKVRYSAFAELDLLQIPNYGFYERYELEIDHPSNVDVAFEWYFPADSVSFSLETVDQKRIRLTADSLPWRPPLAGTEYDDLHALGLMVLRRDDSLLTPATPEAFTSWYLSQFDYPVDLAADLEPDLYAAVQGAPDERAAVERIHDFVRGSIRYVSDVGPPHTILPHAPEDVLANRYGDCKDRAFLVTALARRHGLRVYPCIVSTNKTRAFGDLHPYLFNHVICAIDSDGGLLFFDPTPESYAFGTLPPDYVGCYALVLDTARPRVVTVWPRDTLPDLEVHLTGRIDSLSTVHAEIVVRGGYRSEVLNAQATMTDYEFRSFLSARIPLFLYRIVLDHFLLSTTDDHAVVMSAQADLSSFIIRTSSNAYLPSNPFITVDRAVLERKSDAWPLVTGIPRRYVLTLDLEAPGYTAAADSLRLDVPDIASLEAHLEPTDEEEFRLGYEYRLRATTVAGSAKTAYLEFCRSCLDSKRHLFNLVEETHR